MNEWLRENSLNICGQYLRGENEKGRKLAATYTKYHKKEKNRGEQKTHLQNIYL